jgi:large subunit ribosomal protein L28
MMVFRWVNTPGFVVCNRRNGLMARNRKISGVTPQFGNNRSHSLKATRRQFKPNYQNKRLWVPELDRFVRVKVTAGEIRTIDKIGLPEFLKRRGLTVNDLV